MDVICEQTLHARITNAQVRSGTLHEVMGLFMDSLYPSFKRMEGFKGALLLTNASTVDGITLWEKESDERNWDMSSRYRELTSMMTPLLSGPPAVERYEVSLQM